MLRHQERQTTFYCCSLRKNRYIVVIITIRFLAVCMHWIKTILLISLGIVLYSFIGYGILLQMLRWLKGIVQQPLKNYPIAYEPDITLVVPCYNEADILQLKIANCQALDYPAEKLSFIFITDGSTDHTAEILKHYPAILHLHQNHRAGKTAAENRAMSFVTSPIVVFTDANSLLHRESIKHIVQHFSNEKTGCVSGEKKISTDARDNASGAGESLYWKYESYLKKLDSDFNCAIGAAGELMAIRTSLYRMLPEDTLLDDFMQSMQIAARGYKIVYEPRAVATEKPSANIQAELKRKIRIAQGSWQSMLRLFRILNVLKTPLLYFQYLSRRLLRWAVVPFLLVLIFLGSIPVAMEDNSWYQLLLLLQILFYGLAICGHFYRNHQTRIRYFFVPYYFCIMHYAMIAGLVRYITQPITGIWEKASRKK